MILPYISNLIHKSPFFPFFPLLRSVLLVGLCLLMTGANTHTNVPSDPYSQMRGWFGDIDQPQLNVGSCHPTTWTLGTNTLTNVICKGYVRATDGSLLYVEQAAATLQLPTGGGAGYFWVAIHKDVSTNVVTPPTTNWTRQSGTHYIYLRTLDATQPTTPPEAFLFLKVASDGTTITGIEYLNVNQGAPGSGSAPGGVNVSSCATGGTGTQGDPWTGWDTHCAWLPNTQYRFPGGFYSYAASPAWGLNGISLIGDDRATLLYTGNGNAMTFDGRADADGGKHNIRVENFTISGNASAVRGIYFTHIFRSVVRHVRIRNIAQTAFGCEFCVLVTLDNVGFTSTQESTDELANTVFPTTGLLLDWNASDTTGGCPCYSSANTLINTMWENVHGPGIYVGHAFNTYSLGGTSEHNYYGIQTTGAAQFNIFANMDIEQNVTPTPTGNAVVDAQDIDENGDSNQYIGLFGGATVHVNAGSYGMQIVGGRYSDFVISSTAASLFMTGTVLRHCLASTTPKAPNIRLINVWVSNPQAGPPLHVPHDTWCAGNNNQQMWSSAGNMIVENLVVKPQTLDFSMLAFPPLYNTPALDVVGQSWSQAVASPDSRKGIVQLYNKDNLQQYFYMGIDASAGPAGKGQVYLGGWNGAGGSYPMQGVWGTGSPSALRISTVTAGTINGVDAEAGALIWCSDCTKATDPCTGSGNGAYAYKTTIATWRCP